MILLVDVGNTRIKWGVPEGGRLTRCADLVHREEGWHARLAEAWAALPHADRVVAACVADEQVRAGVAGLTEQRWGVPPEWLAASAEGWGVRNAYAVPQRLGPDRWAALVGARALVPGAACVVDCGTAVTLDVLDADGRHVGGWILPGLTLMRRALGEQTGRLAPVIDEEGEGMRSSLALGRDSADCIRFGTRAAVVAAIERGTGQAVAAVGPGLTCLLTGGDAERLRTTLALSEQPTLRSGLRVVPQLVLHGLARIAGGAAEPAPGTGPS